MVDVPAGALTPDEWLARELGTSSRAVNVLDRLLDCAMGRDEMTKEEIAAARIALNKIIADKKAVEVTGDGGGPLQVQIIRFSDLPS